MADSSEPSEPTALQQIGDALYKMADAVAIAVTEPFVQLAKLCPDPVPPEPLPGKVAAVVVNVTSPAGPGKATINYGALCEAAERAGIDLADPASWR